jgi:hypothetical protein
MVDDMNSTAQNQQLRDETYPEFSPKEVEMFKALGCEDLLKHEVNAAYTAICKLAFLSGIENQAVSSLRRCAQVLSTNLPTIKRLTPEFEQLIRL